MNRISDRECRVPLELMLASFPGWVKWVWVAMRYLQGPNKYCFANQSTIGEKIVLESGAFMSRSQVSKAQKILTQKGFLVKYKQNRFSCTIPSQWEQDSQYEKSSQCEQDSRKCEQGSQKCEQGSHPSKYQKGALKRSTKNKRVKNFSEDDWQYRFSDSTYSRLEALRLREFTSDEARKKGC